MKVRLRDQELLFQAKGLEMVVVDLPEPLFRLADVSFNEEESTLPTFVRTKCYSRRLGLVPIGSG